MHANIILQPGGVNRIKGGCKNIKNGIGPQKKQWRIWAWEIKLNRS